MTVQELLDMIALYDRWVYGFLLAYAMGKTGPIPMLAGYISFSGTLDPAAILATVLTGTMIGSQLRFAVGRRYAPWLYEKFPRFAPWLALGAAGVERYERLLLPLTGRRRRCERADHAAGIGPALHRDLTPEDRLVP